ncbi:MAG: 23S rRNA (guanosine(2251)-2'-O)-methyltransferase RlmB [Candidatus Melainabacteria bacterium]|nr:23S rRNA (guanosine(2251)-2'-O)-methyltransferase RlmB [Candidatus Melainabacteria bacterium]
MSEVLAMVTETGYICGKHAIMAVLSQEPRRVFKIYTAEGLRPDTAIKDIVRLAREAGIPITVVPRSKLDSLMVQAMEGQDAHQGIVASVAPKALLTVADFLAELQTSAGFPHPCLVVALDEVTDPRNMGAIVRSLEAAGALGVILPKHRGGGLGPAFAKAAAGADQTLPLMVATNMAQAIAQFKEAGFWVVGSTCQTSAPAYYQQDYQMPTLLVLGSEDKGMRPVVNKQCDFWVHIPQYGQVASLNVSVAAGILAFEIARQQHQAPVKAAQYDSFLGFQETIPTLEESIED